MQVEDRVLKIICTGEKCEESWGTTVIVEGIILNGEKFNEEDLILIGDWKVESVIYAEKSDSSYEIHIPFKSTDEVEVSFHTQAGSGYIEITLDDLLLREQNLFTPEYGREVIRVDPSPTSIQKIIPWLILLELLAMEWLIVSLLLKFFKLKNIPDIVLMFLGATGLHFAVEILNGNLLSIGVINSLENILLYVLAMLILYILFGKVMVSVVVISAAWMFFALANYYTTLYRGTPITPGDLFIVNTVISVAGNYEYTVPTYFFHSLAVMMPFLFLIQQGKDKENKQNKLIRLRLCLPAVGLYILVAYSGVYEKTMDYWRLTNNVSTYGLGVNFVSSILHMQLEIPDNYSAEAAEAVLLEYTTEESDEFNPSIIVIMNESFSDLSVLNQSLDHDLYLSNYNSITENAIKGIALSSAFGGATANAEYEFLTGNSLFFLPNDVPYQQRIFKNTYSLPGTLKKRGYTAVAIHPFLASNYNRPNVYKYFGFDSFVDIESFSDYELTRNTCMSDIDSYEKVIEEYEKIQATGTPAFIFNVTMQNHSTYDTGYFEGMEDLVSIPGLEGQHKDAEEYLTLIKKSDEALVYLLEYFDRVDEPVVVIFFGDHQPKLNNEFYTEFCPDITESETSAESQDLSDSQKYYEVPFLIWANYDIEEETNIKTSLNYLSSLAFEKTQISCSPYQNFLLELMDDIPVINKYGYRDSTGEWHSQQETDELSAYWFLEYYNIMEEDIR